MARIAGAAHRSALARNRGAVPAAADRKQVKRIYCVGTVPGCPVQMRSRHAPGVSDQSNDLTALHSVADGDQRLAQMEVRRDDATAVIDVDDVAGEKKVVDEADYSAIRCPHRLANGATEVDT